MIAAHDKIESNLSARVERSFELVWTLAVPSGVENDAENAHEDENQQETNGFVHDDLRTENGLITYTLRSDGRFPGALEWAMTSVASAA
jgi:hypothetical protein